MTEDTIRGMRKAELITLFEETAEKIREINQVHDKFLELKRILNEENVLEKIEGVKNKCIGTLSKIQEVEREICGDGENNESAKKRIDRVIEEGKKYIKNFEELKNEMSSHTKTNEQGEKIEHKGYIDTIKEELKEYTIQIDQTYREYEDRYDELYEKIETDLSSGATTVSLSREFKEKVEEYKSARKKWQAGLIITLVLAICYSIFVYYSPSGWESEELILSFMRHLPIFSFIVWLVMFAGNRRAENLKLEEAYKHKESLAKSFIGYKKSIEELGDDDESLLEELMKNLLDAIKKDSSIFLSSKGDNHPMVDMAKISTSRKSESP